MKRKQEIHKFKLIIFDFDGTLVGNPLWVPGKTGNALEFSDNKYVDLGSFSIYNDTSSRFFVDFWIYPTQLVSSYSGGLPTAEVVNRMYYDNDKVGDWAIEIDRTNTLRFNVRNSANNGWHFIFGGSVPNINQWYHIRAEWNNRSMYLYQDGSLVASASGTTFGSDAANTHSIYAGYRPGSPADQKWFRGRIDELQIGSG